MKRFSINTHFLLIFWISIASCSAQDKSPEVVVPDAVELSKDTLAQMTAHFHQLVDDKQLAGIQTAVLSRDKIVHYDTYGFANIEEQKPLDEQSIFRIFSMTKPIVSVGLMQLYEDGKFTLEDPVSKYIPEFKEMFVYTDSGLVPAQTPIRIVDLLTHTSGFSYGRTPYPELDQLYLDAQLYESANNKEYVQRLSKIPLQFEPGTDWQYGVSTNVCGYLIEVLSGKPLDVYLAENVLRPLEMKDTHFQVPQEKVEHFTVGYGWQDSTGLMISETPTDNRYVREVTLFNGGGGMVSTMNDYLNFCQMLLNKGTRNGVQLLKAETIDLMFQDHVQKAREHQGRLRLPNGEAGFGLGFAIRGNEDGEFEQVYGWGGAVGTYFKVDLEHDMTYVMMIQLSPHRHLGLRQLIQDYMDAAVL